MNSFDPTLVHLVINLMWLRSTSVSMPNRLDAIAVELQRVGRWNA